MSMPTLFWLMQTFADVPENNRWLSEREQSVLEKMRFPKRLADWRLGRWTAKRALGSIIENVFDADEFPRIEIIAANDGAPEAYINKKPLATTISISHSNGASLCVVNTLDSAVGCDLEFIEARSKNFVFDYFTGEERASIAVLPPTERILATNLIWSAKESAMKTLREGLRLDTCSVEVFFHYSNNITGWKPLLVYYQAANLVLYGWWHNSNRFVKTLISDSPKQLEPCRIKI